MLSLPSFFPPPRLLLTPLTWVESYQTKWHLRDWLGSFSHLCLEKVECPSGLTGSCWQLLPPIGLTEGLPKNDVMILLGCWLPRYVSLIKKALRQTLFIFSFFFLLLRPSTFLFTTCISSLESLKMWFILFTGTWWTKSEQRSRGGNNRNTCYNTCRPETPHSMLLWLMCQFLKLGINGWGWQRN